MISLSDTAADRWRCRAVPLGGASALSLARVPCVFENVIGRLNNSALTVFSQPFAKQANGERFSFQVKAAEGGLDG